MTLFLLRENFFHEHVLVLKEVAYFTDHCADNQQDHLDSKKEIFSL